jgi:hypothetical protein
MITISISSISAAITAGVICLLYATGLYLLYLSIRNKDAVFCAFSIFMIGFATICFIRAYRIPFPQLILVVP